MFSAGRKCIHSAEEKKICPHLKAIVGWKKKDFILLKKNSNLILPHSNGYIQNFKKRHINCFPDRCIVEENKKYELNSSKDPIFFNNELPINGFFNFSLFIF